jgi:hypothetical protein
LRSEVIKDSNHVNGFERGKQFSALSLGHDGALRTLKGANTGVTINPDKQGITKGAGLLQKTDMARMKEVKTAVGKHDYASSAVRLAGKLDEFFWRTNSAQLSLPRVTKRHL